MGLDRPPALFVRADQRLLDFGLDRARSKPADHRDRPLGGHPLGHEDTGSDGSRSTDPGVAVHGHRFVMFEVATDSIDEVFGLVQGGGLEVFHGLVQKAHPIILDSSATLLDRLRRLQPGQLVPFLQADDVPESLSTKRAQILTQACTTSSGTGTEAQRSAACEVFARDHGDFHGCAPSFQTKTPYPFFGVRVVEPKVPVPPKSPVT